MEKRQQQHGILNIIKPAGMTSHDVVAVVRKRTGIKRCGHGGTLDPAAVGVLPIFLGDATRFIEYYSGTRKIYHAEIIFGVTSETYDYTGKFIEKSGGGPCIEEELQQCFQRFTGLQQQIPPMFSAVKIKGKRLYEFARQGIEVERKSREVHIFSIRVLSYRYHKGISSAVLEVVCSGGTYIRSLCHDIGQYLKCGAVMGFLVRQQANGMQLADGLLLSEFDENWPERLLDPCFGLGHLQACTLDGVQEARFSHGQSVKLEIVQPCDQVIVKNQLSSVIGMGCICEKGVLHPVKVLRQK